MDARPGTSEAAAAPIAPGDCVGRYTVRELLGAGGMGQVYAADDPELGRAVALKVIHTERTSPQARLRLIREAQALARLHHPNVVTVHELGTGEPVFIVMELVEGPTLERWLAARHRSWREITSVLAAAGCGLAAAHAAGVIHRDVKPSNIIVGERVVVVDFGLARIAADRDDVAERIDRAPLAVALTETGAWIGTLAYMAPEQALGGDVTAAADQFAFCVTAWQALHGELPFRGDGDIAERRPPERPPRGDVPARLHAIIERGLATDPADRWPDMRSLLAALEDSLARRAQIAGVLAVALVAVVIAAFVGWRALRSSADRRVAAQQLSREAEQIRGSMRAARLMPLHDIVADRNRLRVQMTQIEAEMAELGDAGRGPGEFALGAAWFSLSSRLDARDEVAKHLEAAWDAGERSPELAFELGSVLVAKYQEAEQHPPPTEGAARDRHEAELRRTLRDPAIAYLRQARGADTSPEYVEAVIALVEYRYDDAIAHGEASLRERPTHYEAGLIVASALSHVALDAFQAGDMAASRSAADRMEAMFARIVDTGRSDEYVYRRYADALGAVAARQDENAIDNAAMLARVDELCVKGQAADSEATWPDILRARTLDSLAINDVRQKRDPREHIHAAVATAERAVQRDPRSLIAQRMLGDAYGDLVDTWEASHGVDPRPSLEASIRAYKAALAIAPDSDVAQGIGVTYMSLAKWQMAHGVDETATVDAAIQSSEDGFRATPREAPVSHPNSCSLLSDQAHFWLAVGRDPEAVLARAKPICEAASAESPGHALTHRAVAAFEDATAIAAWLTGHDPQPAWQRAEVEVARALELEPASPGPHAQLALVHAGVAAYAIAHHRDATGWIGRALAEARRAVELDVESDFMHYALARVALTAARAGNRAAVDEGVRAAARALQLGGEDVDSLLVSAELALVASPRRLADGEAFVDRALAVYPHNARALAIRAALERANGDTAAADATLRAALAAGPLLGSDPIVAR